MGGDKLPPIAMPDVQILDIKDSAVIPGGSQRNIQFRPGQPGPISARCVAANPPGSSESGFLGKLFFRRPGTAAPVATSSTKLGQTVMALDHQVTAAELTAPGNWICEVVNSTETNVTFTTDVTFPGTIQLIQKTATIDIPFLNILLTNTARAAELRVHLQSSPSDSQTAESSVSWSRAIPFQVLGLSEYPFHVDDPALGLYRLVNLPSKPAALGFQPGRLVIELALDFDTNIGKIVDLTSVLPGIELDFFDVVIQLDFAGNITPVCNVQAILRQNSLDISSLIKSDVEDTINARLAAAKVTPKAVMAQLLKYFGLLLRLGPEDAITSFGLDGSNLVINYTTPASAAATHGAGQSGTVAAGAA